MWKLWHPCEIRIFKDASDPVPTDITIQGMFFAGENGIDLWQYHDKVYDLIFREKVNTKDVNILTNALSGLLDGDMFRQALESGKYVSMVKAANEFAFNQTGVHVVPTFRADDSFLQDRQEFFNMGPSDTGYGGSRA